MVKSLVDEDLGVAVDAKDVLHAQISRDHNFGSQVVFGTHSQILNEMAKNEKETLRMRLYDFVVAVAKVGILLAQVISLQSTMMDQTVSRKFHFQLFCAQNSGVFSLPP